MTPPHFLKWGDEPPISFEASQLRFHGLLFSITEEDPGFIPDYWLEGIGAETTTTALELEMAGIWERGFDIVGEDGYFDTDKEFVEQAKAIYERHRALRQGGEG